MDMSGETVGGIIALVEVLFVLIMLGMLELRLILRKKLTKNRKGMDVLLSMWKGVLR